MHFTRTSWLLILLNIHTESHSIYYTCTCFLLLKILCFTGCPIEGQVFQRCASCPATCSRPDVICHRACFSGCGCPAGQLIDTVNSKCVDRKECPVDCAVSSIHSICIYIIYLYILYLYKCTHSYIYTPTHLLTHIYIRT